MAARARVRRWGGVVLSLAAAAGGLVGLRAAVSLEPPRFAPLLRVPLLPRETLGLTWSPRAVWPQELQEAGMARLAALVGALFLAAVAVALLNALFLLVEAGAARRREMALRAAVGAGPWALVRLLGRQVRALLAAGCSLGLLLGLAAGGALRAAWPGVAEGVGWSAAAAQLSPLLVLLVGAAAAAYVWVGLSVSARGSLAPALASGGRLTADRGEAFRMRALSALQMGLAGAVSLGALTLARSARAPGALAPGAADAVAVAVDTGASAPGWATLLPALEAVGGVAGVALASPGALAGLGVRDNAVAQCGDCYRGGLPLPFWGARADHHAVDPGFFVAVGMPAADGRLFDDADALAGRRVAVINRTFANLAFEEGAAVGHLLRVGRDLDGWYEVVGVVEDRVTPVVGGDDRDRAAVYLHAARHPYRRGELVVRGTEDGVAGVLALLTAEGIQVGEPRSLADAAREAAAPLAWTARLALALGLLALALALHGVLATTVQITRRRTHELAIRQVLGAPPWRLLVHVLAASARTALGGVALALFAGPLLVALLRKAAAGVPAPGPGAYAAVTGLLVVAALVASARAGREALSVAPAEVLE